MPGAAGPGIRPKAPDRQIGAMSVSLIITSKDRLKEWLTSCPGKQVRQG